MKNCIILGSGRSGTSMVAGTLWDCGYFMGDHLYKPREANPKGFFESPDINGLNEDLLAKVLPKRPPLLGCCFFRDRPKRQQRWLARVPLETAWPPLPKIEKRINSLVSRQPFCFKDPRFCYTLPIWRPYLKNTAYLCVFRHPAVTAESILKECATAPYLRSLRMDFVTAVDVWRHMYDHILQKHRQEGDWLFVHFDQVITGDALGRIETLLDIKVNASFPDAKLRRSTSDQKMDDDVNDIYHKLCDLANFEP